MRRLFSRLYSATRCGAVHPRAPWFLAALSFAESSFFPVPPDVMLAPMVLVQPRRALHFASLTTLASVLGGLLGYVIGYYAFELVRPLLYSWGQWHSYLTVRDWFGRWGFWAILVAGFSPIPYKVFTIAAGAMHVAIIPFLLASLLGRGGRFFLVAILVAWGGVKLEPWLRTYIDWVGWVTVAVLMLIAVYLRLL
ncbi:MAG: DedA family protein [Nitrococcus mobilis]|nr:DedA family protein [Nitrococcus mobilis]